MDDNNHQSKYISDWVQHFYVSYNDAYRSYLNNVQPVIFMNTLLTKIIEITSSTSGYIASYHKSNNVDFLRIEAYCINKCEDNGDKIYVYGDIIKLENYNSICALTVKSQKIKIINNIKIVNFFDEPIKGFSRANPYLCLPYFFNNELVGVIGLSGSPKYKNCKFEDYGTLGNLIGVLQNNYINAQPIKIDDQFSSKLINDVLNCSQNGIVITDNSFNTIFINKNGENILNKKILLGRENVDTIHELVLSHDSTDMSKSTNLISIFPELSEFSDDNKNNRLQSDNLEIVIDSLTCDAKVFHVISLNICKNAKNNNLIAYLSHELRNLLQTITLANYLLKIQLTNKLAYDEPKSALHLEVTEKSCFKMKKIINDILDLAKIDAKEFVIDLEVCNIRNIIEEISNEFTYIANLKELKMIVTIDDDIKEDIYTDPTRLYQILNNLLSNAVKYSEKGTIRFDIMLDKENNDIKFSVTDEGIGIREDEYCKLFKDFGKTMSSCKIDKFASTGLGLCVSQKISKLLGGNITVSSEYGTGSTFTLIHPIKTIPIVNDIGTFDYNMNNRTGNVLIVDDDNENLKMFHLLLEHLNESYNINIIINLAANGNDAIGLCGINKYDIVFLDINMMGMDGYVVSKILKTMGYEGKIVATTGNILACPENRVNNEIEKYEYFDDIIIKPFNDSTVLSIFKKYFLMPESKTNQNTNK